MCSSHVPRNLCILVILIPFLINFFYYAIYLRTKTLNSSLAINLVDVVTVGLETQQRGWEKQAACLRLGSPGNVASSERTLLNVMMGREFNMSYRLHAISFPSTHYIRIYRDEIKLLLPSNIQFNLSPSRQQRECDVLFSSDVVPPLHNTVLPSPTTVLVILSASWRVHQQCTRFISEFDYVVCTSAECMKAYTDYTHKIKNPIILAPFSSMKWASLHLQLQTRPTWAASTQMDYAFPKDSVEILKEGRAYSITCRKTNSSINRNGCTLSMRSDTSSLISKIYIDTFARSTCNNGAGLFEAYSYNHFRQNLLCTKRSQVITLPNSTSSANLTISIDQTLRIL